MREKAGYISKRRISAVLMLSCAGMCPESNNLSPGSASHGAGFPLWWPSLSFATKSLFLFCAKPTVHTCLCKEKAPAKIAGARCSSYLVRLAAGPGRRCLVGILDSLQKGRENLGRDSIATHHMDADVAFRFGLAGYDDPSLADADRRLEACLLELVPNRSPEHVRQDLGLDMEDLRLL